MITHINRALASMPFSIPSLHANVCTEELFLLVYIVEVLDSGLGYRHLAGSVSVDGSYAIPMCSWLILYTMWALPCNLPYEWVVMQPGYHGSGKHKPYNLTHLFTYVSP